jgi:hypothetical protein
MSDDAKIQADELAALKARVAELEEKAKPPKPFVPKPYEPIDWTARMSMPPSALQAMVAAEPRGFMAGVVGDNRAPIGPSSAVPSSQQVTGSGGGPANVPGSGTGWAREIPLGPSMHQRYVDQQFDAQDAKDRQERLQQAAQTETARKFAEQTEKLRQLADRVAEQNKKLTEPGK